jgi:3-hydroxyacyl-[acyl-carrier-protein] dehydratase
MSEMPDLEVAGPATITAVLPHRHPILLVDRVVELEPRRRAVTLKAVTLAEPCYAGIPDGAPDAAYAYPPSLILESFCQSGALLWLADSAGTGDGSLVFAVARGVRFHHAVHPADVLRHTVVLERTVGANAFLTGSTSAGGRTVAEYTSLVAAVRPEKALAG